MNKKKLLKRAEWSCSILKHHFNSQKPTLKLCKVDDDSIAMGSVGMGAIIK
jgi:hypothetical protein